MSHSPLPAVPNLANDPSARFFGAIGLAPGMRVLDLGCGQGDLSRFVTTLVGPGGEVVGVDRSEAALTAARAAAIDPHAAPIRYDTADLAGPLSNLGHFDAIVGRRVLMYLPDAAATLAELARLAAPGALVAFQEHARIGLPAGLGDLPEHRRLYDWMWRMITAEGGDATLALRLVELMRAAGFAIDQARSEGVLLQPGTPSFLPSLAAALLPRLVACRVATADEVALDTLADRLDEERWVVGGTIVWDLAILVSAHATH